MSSPLKEKTKGKRGGKVVRLSLKVNVKVALKVASSAGVGWVIGGCEAEGVGAAGDVSRQVGGSGG